jgi:SAM-dependent methyltransferase
MPCFRRTPRRELKEQDIRPSNIFDRYLQLTAADAETFFADRSLFQGVPCPACQTPGTGASFVKHGFEYQHCGVCGTLYVSPRPSSEALAAFYGDSPSATYWADVFFPASIEARKLQIFAPRVERLIQVLETARLDPRTIIDVGAGYGLFLDAYRARRPGTTLLAVEPGRKLAAICREKGYETLEEPVESADAWHGRGDLAVCFEVLEHVFEPVAFVEAMSSLLRPGGYVLVSSLSADGFDIQVLWDRSRSVSPPHHLNFMSVSGFERLFARAGLTDIQVLTPGRLDVDIVRGALASDPSVVQNRFLRLLLSRGGDVLDGFQRFLADNRLSSHAWVLAHKAEASV